MCSVNAILSTVFLSASRLYGLVALGVSIGSSGEHVCSFVSFDDGWLVLCSGVVPVSHF